MHASAAVATELVKPHQPAELQVLGYTLLQHLVRGGCRPGCRSHQDRHACQPPPGALESRQHCRRCSALTRAYAPSIAAHRLPVQVGNRWDEFSADEHSQLATLSYNMLQQGESTNHVVAATVGEGARSPMSMNLVMLACCAAVAGRPPPG